MASTSGTKDQVGPPLSLSRRMTMTSTMFDPNAEGIDSDLVPSSLASIALILRVANEIEKDNDRVAYLYVILDSLLSFRKELKDKFVVKVSVNDIAIKTVAIALRNVPKANAFWDDNKGEIILCDSVDISIAVATEKVGFMHLRRPTEWILNLVDVVFSNSRLTCYIDSKVPPSADRQQLQLLYIALYLLIWGEASNIRFIPECICYIFHNMAKEMHGTLFTNVQPVSGGTYQIQAAPLGEEAFLRDLVTPICEVLRKVTAGWQSKPCFMEKL